MLVQDADLEYDPRDYPRLLQPILEDRADVVFGSRFTGGESHRVLYFWHSVVNKLLTLLSNMLTDLNLTDMEVCYKVFRRSVLERITIEEDRFGFEPEITAKVAKLGCRIYEVGISYSGRTYEEGKKIGWRDGVRAVWCILKYNLLRCRRSPSVQTQLGSACGSTSLEVRRSTSGSSGALSARRRALASSERWARIGRSECRDAPFAAHHGRTRRATLALLSGPPVPSRPPRCARAPRRRRRARRRGG